MSYPPQSGWGEPQHQRPVQVKRPWYKKKRFVIPLGLLSFMILVGIFAPDPEPAAVVADPPAAVATTNDPAPCPTGYLNEGDGCVVDPDAVEQTDEPVVEETTTQAPKPKPKKTHTVTSGEENALDSAENYLEFQAFSRKGLIKQLKFEKYSTSEATYAVEHITVDWNDQAAKSAQNYLDTQSFSKSGLLRQLKFEGFTTSQAKYGVEKAY